MYVPLVLEEAWKAAATSASISIVSPRSTTISWLRVSTYAFTQFEKMFLRTVWMTLLIHLN